MAAKEIKNLSFEEALTELEEIVRGLENGSANLEEAINFYERGAKLKQHCEKKLNEAKVKVDKINFEKTTDKTEQNEAS